MQVTPRMQCFWRSGDENPKVNAMSYSQTAMISASKAPDSLTGQDPKQTVMVVDDEPMVGTMTGHCLRRAGYETMIFNDPLDARDWFTGHGDDVAAVITDQTMPGMVGTDLARHIHEINPHVPVLICSGYAMAVDPASAAYEAVHAVLNKPVPTHKLLESLKDAIQAADSNR